MKSTTNKLTLLVAMAGTAACLAVTNARATILTFEDLAVGTTLANQYAGLGVTFLPNAFTGAGGPNGSWANNTDMTIVSSAGSDVGGLGTPSLVSGNVLRSFAGWLNENGDPSFSADFSTPIFSFSADFAGVAVPSSTRLFVYDGATLLGTVVGSVGTGQFTLSFAAPSITKVIITGGDFNDWVGIDNVTFQQVSVPEPASVSLALLGGFALLALRRKTMSRK